jgi:hypothetical protein
LIFVIVENVQQCRFPVRSFQTVRHGWGRGGTRRPLSL